MSTGIVTGAYATVASALDYWMNISHSNGVTSDAYLTPPVGVRSLNFGQHAIKDLSAYNNPDGINGILAYTAVPAFDVNNLDSLSTPLLLSTTDNQHGFPGGTVPPAYARVDIGNAVASIEGTIAIQYLLDHHIFPLIDGNNDGLITAQEIQNFTDTAAQKGMAEAGAMARLLGGTSTYALPEADVNNRVFNENPDQPAVLQRRYNYFDYMANGQLKGGISIDSFKMLAQTLLPLPDQYTIIDRQRASANGFLVDPTAVRNFVALQHLLPSYMWVPKTAKASWKSIARYRNMSPLKLGIDRNVQPGSTFPLYTLFSNGAAPSVTTGSTVVKTGSANGQTFSVGMTPVYVSTASSQPVATATNTTSVTPTVTSTPVAASSVASTNATTASPTVSSGSSASASPTNTGTATGNNAQAILDALRLLAQGQNASSSTTTGSLTPAGTLTPLPTTTTSAATTTTPIATAATTAVTATTSASSAVATGTSSAAAAAAAAAQDQQVVVKKTAVKAAQTTKKRGFFDQLWVSIKKPFGG